jgi:hypothetical protein
MSAGHPFFFLMLWVFDCFELHRHRFFLGGTKPLTFRCMRLPDSVSICLGTCRAHLTGAGLHRLNWHVQFDVPSIEDTSICDFKMSQTESSAGQQNRQLKFSIGRPESTPSTQYILQLITPQKASFKSNYPISQCVQRRKVQSTAWIQLAWILLTRRIAIIKCTIGSWSSSNVVAC